MDYTLLINLISVIFGGTGIVSYFGARRERIASAKKVESEVFAGWADIYDKMAAATEKKIADLVKEIEELKKELNDYKSRCKLCEKK